MSSERDPLNGGEYASSADSTVPAAVPAASSSEATNTPSSGPSSNSSTGKSSTSFRGVDTSRGRPASLRTATGKLAILALRESMPARDLAVLRSVASHRFLTTQQITALHFRDTSQDRHGSRVARKVLKRLDDSGVLAHLEQRIGGMRAGSDGMVWHVGPVGDRLLRFGSQDRVRRGRRYEPSVWFLRHCLAIADLHVRLSDASHDGRFGLLGTDLEPGTWRDYTDSTGVRRVLKPDLGAVTTIDEYVDHFWFEVDLGTEHFPTILDKCRAYETYRQTGLEDERRGPDVFPVVVWVMHTNERAERLREELFHARDLDESLFRVTTPVDVIDVVAGGAA